MPRIDTRSASLLQTSARVFAFPSTSIGSTARVSIGPKSSALAGFSATALGAGLGGSAVSASALRFGTKTAAMTPMTASPATSRTQGSADDEDRGSSSMRARRSGGARGARDTVA